MCRGATASLQEKEEVSIDQGEVWADVEERLLACKAVAPTRDYHAIHEKMERELMDCETHLPFPEHACGVAVEISGTLRAVDLFDKPDTLRQFWPRLVKSYSVSALMGDVRSGSKAGVKAFLEHALASKQESYEPVGIGTTIRLTNAEAMGAALVCEKKIVHLSIFAKETQGSEPLQTEQPVNQIIQTRPNIPRRSWWRFWA